MATEGSNQCPHSKGRVEELIWCSETLGTNMASPRCRADAFGSPPCAGCCGRRRGPR
jgi:hypothetical protein